MVFLDATFKKKKKKEREKQMGKEKAHRFLTPSMFLFVFFFFISSVWPRPVVCKLGYKFKSTGELCKIPVLKPHLS